MASIFLRTEAIVVLHCVEGINAMFEHSRRTFIRLGALVAASPLVGKWISVPLAAGAGDAAARPLVTIRARLVPVSSDALFAEYGSGVVFGEYAQTVSLAWSQSGRALLPAAFAA